ncbi:hypothetical protein K437DRAFT_254919 [Tilletiaria anomala UBC 951]|uniref:Uncharacterized protein n=1 Tax=Tilletiaria anomala (strain ATCC 24038 / CBS 436.72 / UBC 951) TaxID=1037660 RepID=A0A066WC87_TILAU|nr:uncharacterized protein K437DRAFT_254919 [Tilletiaria anomala UBC 951]KDN51331.1 hypothetical protein K437DRAFT_254919 [Tilletiaria anomala UBC 951]
MSSNGQPQAKGSRNRNRTFALAGATLAVLSLSYSVYRWYQASNAPRPPSLPRSAGLGGSASGADDSRRSQAATGRTARNGASRGQDMQPLAARPTLTLSLPPEFPHTPQALGLLSDMLSDLAPHYLIHLIIPAAPSSSAPSSRSPPALDEVHTLSEEVDVAFDLTAGNLSRTFSHIQSFDARRILEYSKPEGRHALARALACDAHLHVLLAPPSAHSAIAASASTAAGEVDGYVKHEEGIDEPASPSEILILDDETEGEALRQEILRLEQLQKSCGLVIILSLTLHTAKASGKKVRWLRKDNEEVSRTFEGRPGFRVSDLASRADVEGAWMEGTARLIELRSGWR